MAFNTSSEALPSAAAYRAEDVAEILRGRGWLSANPEIAADEAIRAWLARAAELLGPQAADRNAFAELLSLVFNYDAATVLRKPASQAVLAREGARDVIRELANRVLGGGEIDSDRFKEIIDGVKAAIPQRSRELFHPVRLALAGRVGEGELDRVILLLDSAAKLEFAARVKGTRQRMLEFCAAMD
jgi:nondiscriminating glutamyl-tRNA synthetase